MVELLVGFSFNIVMDIKKKTDCNCVVATIVCYNKAVIICYVLYPSDTYKWLLTTDPDCAHCLILECLDIVYEDPVDQSPSN